MLNALYIGTQHFGVNIISSAQTLTVLSIGGSTNETCPTRNSANRMFLLKQTQLRQRARQGGIQEKHTGRDGANSTANTTTTID